MASAMYPPPKESYIKRQKMPYPCKFGKFLTQPVGVSVNTQNDIITVDAKYNIKIFSQVGGMIKHLKLQVQQGGGQFLQTLHPSNVTVCKKTGEIIVTVCGSSHQVQVYSKHGKFIRKVGASFLEHPNAVCVDSMGRFIVVDSKLKWIVIFDQSGNLLKMFGCSQYLQFPNGVATNDKQEIFISDFRAHCVKVFDYDGNFIRKIGGEGITNFPRGVGINIKGEVIVADNHYKSFHVTVFSQDGFLLSALESKVKHAACKGMAVMDDRIVVLSSQELNQVMDIYIYKYAQYHSSRSTLLSSTSPFPRFGDQRSYICVSNDERNVGGFIRLPLSPDFTLSASVLKIMFPDAIGLYYYSADNLIMGVFQNEEKLFPLKSGDAIIYITKKTSTTDKNYFKTTNEGSASRKNQLVSPGYCDFSDFCDLKQNVNEMRLTMNQLRREISELKEEQNTSQNGSLLDVNASIFKPAEEAAFTVKETEDDAKDANSEDAAREAIAELSSEKVASKPGLREIEEDTLSQTEKYRRERFRLHRMSQERSLHQTQFISDMASSGSSLPGAGSSLSGDSLMPLRMLSIEQDPVKQLASVKSQLINVQVGHVMGGVKVEPSRLATGSYKASDDRCSSITSDKAIEVNVNRLPTKARGRNIKILKGVKKPGGMM